MEDPNFSREDKERNCITFESPLNMDLAYAMLRKFLEEEVKSPPLSEPKYK